VTKGRLISLEGLFDPGPLLVHPQSSMQLSIRIITAKVAKPEKVRRWLPLVSFGSNPCPFGKETDHKAQTIYVPGGLVPLW
jgi:hypothetical protein